VTTELGEKRTISGGKSEDGTHGAAAADCGVIAYCCCCAIGGGRRGWRGGDRSQGRDDDRPTATRDGQSSPRRSDRK